MPGVAWSFESGITDRLFLGQQELEEVWLGDKWVWPPPMPKAQMDATGNSVPPIQTIPLVRNSIIWDPSLGAASGSWLMDYVVYLYDATAHAIVVDPMAVDENGNPQTSAGGGDPSQGIYNARHYVEWRGSPWPWPAGHTIELRKGYFGPNTADPTQDELYARYTTVAQINPPLDLYAIDEQASLDSQIGHGGLPHLDLMSEVPVFTTRMRRPLKWLTAGADLTKWKWMDMELTTSPYGGSALATWKGDANNTLLNPPGGKWPLGYLYVNVSQNNDPAYTDAAPGAIAAIKVIA